MKFYEIRCRKCGARFNPPDEYFSEHSNVKKLIPKNIKRFARHRPVVGKLIDFEEIWDKGRKIVRKRLLVTNNEVDHEWEYKDGKLTPLNIPKYNNYKELVEKGQLNVKKVATVEEFVRDNFIIDEIEEMLKEITDMDHHQIKRKGDDIVIYASKDDHRMEEGGNSKKVILYDTERVDIDGSFCYSFTVEAEDFDIVPMRAIVEKKEREDGRIEYLLKCPECNEVCIRIVR